MAFGQKLIVQGIDSNEYLHYNGAVINDVLQEERVGKNNKQARCFTGCFMVDIAFF